MEHRSHNGFLQGDEIRLNEVLVPFGVDFASEIVAFHGGARFGPFTRSRTRLEVLVYLILTTTCSEIFDRKQGDGNADQVIPREAPLAPLFHTGSNRIQLLEIGRR